MSPTEAPGAAVTVPATDPEAERYRSVAHRLHEIAKPIRGVVGIALAGRGA
jgi:hypothetical protein